MTISNINNQYYTTFLSDLLRSQISNNSYYCIQILQECGIIVVSMPVILPKSRKNISYVGVQT